MTITESGKYRVIRFREDVRLREKKKKKNVIKTIGNCEQILAEDPDVRGKLRAEAKRITEEKKSSNALICLEVSAEEILQVYAIIQQLSDRMIPNKFILDQVGRLDAQKVI